MPLAIVHNPLFTVELSPSHRFPMPKYAAIADAIIAEGLASAGSFHSPGQAPAQWVTLAHEPSYVDQVFAANVPDAINRMIGFAVTKAVAKRARLACAGTVLAGRLALEHGIATSTAGGSHHAKRAHGAGFCVFNDVGVAASVLLACGEIGTALAFDCDVHQGDGTAEIFRDEPRVKTVSLHCENNFPARKEHSDLDFPLAAAMEDDAYIAVLAQALPASLALGRPDLVFYNAGVDPHRGDRLGHLSLSDHGLAERDRRVIGFFRERNIPVACVMGGGYGEDIGEIVARHLITHRIAGEFAGQPTACPAPSAASG